MAKEIEYVATCPWCDEEPHMQRWHGGGPQKTMIGCDNPDCEIQPSTTAPTRKKAIAKWSDRQSCASLHEITREFGELSWRK